MTGRRFMQYIIEHAVDEANEKFYNELKEVLKKDIQDILKTFNISDEDKAEKIAKLLCEKCIDEIDSRINLAKLSVALLKLKRLVEYIVKNQMTIAEKFNRYLNVVFEIPEIYKDIHEILFEKHGANTNP